MRPDLIPDGCFVDAADRPVPLVVRHADGVVAGRLIHGRFEPVASPPDPGPAGFAAAPGTLSLTAMVTNP